MEKKIVGQHRAIARLAQLLYTARAPTLDGKNPRACRLVTMMTSTPRQTVPVKRGTLATFYLDASVAGWIAARWQPAG